MMTTPGQDSKHFLKHYVTERLPELAQGAFELPGDPPSFAIDQRYVPLRATV
jgi:hypothetical protein